MLLENVEVTSKQQMKSMLPQNYESRTVQVVSPIPGLRIRPTNKAQAEGQSEEADEEGCTKWVCSEL